jgi:RHS repeat-associated protein
MTTDENGQVVEDYDYLPFGEPWGTPQVPEARGFAGKERDPAGSLDYFGARYYASGSGRFTTVDPYLDLQKAFVDPQQWNRYTYVRNNPLRYVDPDGRAIETPGMH